MDIPIKKIILTDTNVREIIDEEYIKTLAESISRHGLFSPIIVRPIGDGTFELIIGRNRMEAFKLLKRDTIPAIYFTENTENSEEKRIISIEENIKRKDLTPYEIFKVISILRKKYQLTELKDKLGMEISTISSYDTIATAIENKTIADNILNELKSHTPKITIGHCYLLQKISDKKEQEELADEVITKEISVAELARIVKRKLKVKRRKEEREVTIKDIEIPKNQLIESDNINQVPDKSIDLIIADPYYNISQAGKSTKKGCEIVNMDWGEEDRKDRGEYLKWLRKQIQDFDRVLRPEGQIYIFIDKIMITPIWDMLMEETFEPKNIVIFRKTNPVPNPRANYNSATEFIIWAVKGTGYTFNKKHPNEMHNFIELPICGGKERYIEHPLQKPVALIKHLIEISSNKGDNVLDPYAGTGTTAVACKEIDRNWIVVEKEKKYIDIIKERIAKCKK